MFEVKKVYDTTAAIQETIDLTPFVGIIKLAGSVGDEYVKLYPKLPERLTPATYGGRQNVGFGFYLTPKVNFLQLRSDFPLITLQKLDKVTIHFEQMAAMEIAIEYDPTRNEDLRYFENMTGLTDNQMLFFADNRVSHIEYHSIKNDYKATLQFANKYNCQYETQDEGAELLKVVAMRVCGCKIVMLHQAEQSDGFLQYELIE